jgi:hypothetical protein
MFRFKPSNVDPLLAKYMLEKTYESIEKKKVEKNIKANMSSKRLDINVFHVGVVSFTLLSFAIYLIKGF